MNEQSCPTRGRTSIEKLHKPKVRRAIAELASESVLDNETIAVLAMKATGTSIGKICRELPNLGGTNPNDRVSPRIDYALGWIHYKASHYAYQERHLMGGTG